MKSLEHEHVWKFMGVEQISGKDVVKCLVCHLMKYKNPGSGKYL